MKLLRTVSVLRSTKEGRFFSSSIQLCSFILNDNNNHLISIPIIPKTIDTPKPIDTPKTIEHRPYQHDSVNACLDALRRGVSRIGVSLPTGSGKTTVFLNLVHKIPNKNSNQRFENGLPSWRSMVIVNSVELAHQTIQQLRKLFPNTSVGIEQASKHASHDAEVVVATYQSLHSKDRFKKFDPAQFKSIIVDEAHHALSTSYLRILSHFNRNVNHNLAANTNKNDNNPSLSQEKEKEEENLIREDSKANQLNDQHHQNVPIIGFSATFSRHDRLALSTVFEEIVYHYELKDMIQAGWLAPAKFTSVKADMDLSQVGLTSGKEPDYVSDRLAEVVDTDSINKLLVSVYLERAAGRKSTLIFAVNIRHMYRLANKFREAGIDARVIFSGTTPLERRELLQDFKSLKFPVLVNCAVLTEGADVPNVDCIILARPTRSKTLLTQMIGRGLRKSPTTNKTDCFVIDLLGSAKYGVVVTPSLDGLDPDQLRQWASSQESNHPVEPEGLVTSETDSEIKNSKEGDQDADSMLVVKKYSYTDFEFPFEDQRGGGQDYNHPGDLYRLTRYSWVACGDGIFVLELLGQGYLRIQPERENGEIARYVIYHLRKKKIIQPSKTFNHPDHSIFIKPRSIGTASCISDAIHTADKYLVQVSKKSQITGLSLSMLKSLERNAPWRNLPASAEQIKIIEKRLGKTKIGEKKGLINDLNNETVFKKGQAANLLTRLNHGFKSRILNPQILKNKKLDKIVQKNLRFNLKVGKLIDN